LPNKEWLEMKLTRTMEVEVDLPEAPEGWYWYLLQDQQVQVALCHGSVNVACITGADDPVALLIHGPDQYRRQPPKFRGQRAAAEYLFAELNIGPYFFTASGNVGKVAP